jgi:hypothetical protein
MDLKIAAMTLLVGRKILPYLTTHSVWSVCEFKHELCELPAYLFLNTGAESGTDFFKLLFKFMFRSTYFCESNF